MELLEVVQPWVDEFLVGYTGCVNLEVIGDYIIEAQLRMGILTALGMFNLCLLFTSCTTLESGISTQQCYSESFFLAALFAQPNKIFNII